MKKIAINPPQDIITFAFVGAKNMGLKVLTTLLQSGYKPLFIVTLPDQSPQELAAFRQLGNSFNVPCYVEPNLANHTTELAKCHYVIVAQFSEIDAKLLALPKWGFVNLHPSLLPQHRGEDPISWALINGDSKTGVTLHYLTEDKYAGDVISQRQCGILPHHTIHTLTAALDASAAQLARQFVQSNQKAKTKPHAMPQSPGGSFANPRSPSDSKIDWQSSAESVVNLIRALQPPFPLAFAVDKNSQPIQFIKAHTIVCTKGKIGDVVAVHPPKLLTVKCQHHAVVLEAAEPVKVSVGDNLVN